LADISALKIVGDYLMEKFSEGDIRECRLLYKFAQSKIYGKIVYN